MEWVTDKIFWSVVSGVVASAVILHAWLEDKLILKKRTVVGEELD